VATLEVKLPAREVLKPGNTVRTTDPTEEFENVGADGNRTGASTGGARREVRAPPEAVEDVDNVVPNP
jgi:hypothetical protein